MLPPGNANLFSPPLRYLIGYGGLAISAVCTTVLALAMADVLTGFDRQFFHQSGIRWISEGAVGGMLIAAVGFWKND